MKLRERAVRARNQIDRLLKRIEECDEGAMATATEEVGMNLYGKLMFLEEGIAGNCERRRHFHRDNGDEWIIEKRQETLEEAEDLLEALTALEGIMEIADGKNMRSSERSEERLERIREHGGAKIEDPIPESPGAEKVREASEVVNSE